MKRARRDGKRLGGGFIVIAALPLRETGDDVPEVAGQIEEAQTDGRHTHTLAGRGSGSDGRRGGVRSTA